MGSGGSPSSVQAICLAMGLLLAGAGGGCGASGGAGDSNDGMGADLADVHEAAEFPHDPGNGELPGDPGVDPAGDELVPADVPAEVPADLPGDPGGDQGPPFVCPAYGSWPSVDDGQRKFGLTMFHWNIQYVAGGLVGEWNGQPISICEEMFGSPELCDGWTDDALNDWIIRVSFQPILDLYLAHPDWRATFEMPGLMVQAMQQRHPDVLAKLQCVANSGQIEIVSFHWSDQLFLAFPSRDLRWSIAYNRRVFEEAGLPLSGVVFNQEGQSGVGKHRVMAETGYTIDVMHRNLYRYHQREDVDDGVWPVYRSRWPGASEDVLVVVSGGVDPAAGVDVKWTFFDDGETLATPGNPYLAPVQPEPDLQAVREFERSLQGLADQGYLHTTITDYVARLERLGIEPRPLLPIADCTWQPPSTEGISRWMGRMGTLGYSFHENDNRIRTGNYQASLCLAGASLLADLVSREGHDVTGERAFIDEGYLDLVRAEVSDATGINPWLGEWVYGLRYNESAEESCSRAVDGLLARWSRDHVILDLDSGEEKPDGTFEPQFMLAPTRPEDLPVVIETTAPGRTVHWTWADDGRVFRGELEIGPSDDPGGEDRAKRTVTLGMPLADGVLRYTPALVEDQVVSIPLADFHLLANQIYVPLANGLIGLGPDLWLLKSCRDVHLAARVSTGDTDRIEFIDETVPQQGGVTWVFYLVRGAEEDALQMARLINTHPNLLLARSDGTGRSSR
ncbi:MAG TPA: hypothetical protein PLQ97_00455 [Myxococcota bacterium]|nr:hypothetical protein [Myxococcota bacterium]HQK49645.1 hypothetical protein [Myxococcota bacterium]